jgi:hypothetical protein
MLSQDELRELFEKRNRFCVSIFLPTFRSGKDEKGRIQLKDLLRDADARLASAGLAEAGIAELLAPAGKLTEPSEFWRHQGDGLGLFLAHGYFRSFHLPLRLPAFVAVEDRFEITPLLPLWTLEDRFHLLALSLNRERFFEGTRYAIFERKVSDISPSLPKTLESSLDESQRQQHTFKPGLPEDELRYFRQIDQGLRRLLTDPKVPLVLAGVEEDISFYRRVNTFAGLLDGYVVGNPDRLSAEELHAKAREIVQAHYDRLRHQAVRQYVERKDPVKTSDQLEGILPAASGGRIRCLFVAAGAEKWGRFDPEQNELSMHESAERGDQELVNLAVIQTILHQGEVYTLARSEMPNGALVAALFRY